MKIFLLCCAVLVNLNLAQANSLFGKKECAKALVDRVIDEFSLDLAFESGALKVSHDSDNVYARHSDLILESRISFNESALGMDCHLYTEKEVRKNGGSIAVFKVSKISGDLVFALKVPVSVRKVESSTHIGGNEGAGGMYTTRREIKRVSHVTRMKKVDGLNSYTVVETGVPVFYQNRLSQTIRSSETNFDEEQCVANLVERIIAQALTNSSNQEVINVKSIDDHTFSFESGSLTGEVKVKMTYDEAATGLKNCSLFTGRDVEQNYDIPWFWRVHTPKQRTVLTVRDNGGASILALSIPVVKKTVTERRTSHGVGQSYSKERTYSKRKLSLGVIESLNSYSVEIKK